MRKYYPEQEIFFPLFVFFVFSTPHYLQKSLFLTGNTVELLLIAFLLIWFINKVALEDKITGSSCLILGVISGFGLWIQYLFLIFIISFSIFWIFKEGLKIFKLKFWQYLLGFLIGFSPWIIYNLLYKFPSIFADVRITEGFFYSKSLHNNL